MKGLNCSKRIWFIFFLLFGYVLVLSQSHNPKKIVVGFSKSLFSDVDSRDATVAIKMWGDELLKNMEINLSPESVIFESNDDIINAVKRNELDLISLPVMDYLEIRDRLNFMPYLITATNSKPGYELILIVRKDRNFKKIADLKNSIVCVPSGAVGQIVEMWLTTYLNKNKENYKNFFQEIKTVDKPSQALLPVFFKQIDACIIPFETYNTMIELNPQLKNELKIIEKSQTIVNGIMCLNNVMDKSLIGPILRASKNINKSNSGRQIMTLFKADGVIEYDEKYLANTEDLFKNYKSIKNLN